MRLPRVAPTETLKYKDYVIPPGVCPHPQSPNPIDAYTTCIDSCELNILLHPPRPEPFPRS